MGYVTRARSHARNASRARGTLDRASRAEASRLGARIGREPFDRALELMLTHARPPGRAAGGGARVGGWYALWERVAWASRASMAAVRGVARAGEGNSRAWNVPGGG